MDRLIYSSLSAMKAAMARQATTANNLANVNTSGFRAEMTSSQALYMKGNGFAARAPTSEEVLSADMGAGTVAESGRSLDVSMQGTAMLAVQSKDGDEAYTRRGDLQVSDSGLLTTGDGLPVLGDGGPITLPPNEKVIIAGDGTISVIPQGGDGQAQQVDRLKLVQANTTAIAKGLDGLFRVREGGTLPADPDATVRQGALEGSNVNTSGALIDMIQASRDWDMQIKMLSTAQDLDKSTTALMQIE